MHGRSLAEVVVLYREGKGAVIWESFQHQHVGVKNDLMVESLDLSTLPVHLITECRLPFYPKIFTVCCL